MINSDEPLVKPIMSIILGGIALAIHFLTKRPVEYLQSHGKNPAQELEIYLLHKGSLLIAIFLISIGFIGIIKLIKDR